MNFIAGKQFDAHEARLARGLENGRSLVSARLSQTLSNLDPMANFSIRTLLIATLVAAVLVATFLYVNRSYSVSGIPRPNSGGYSTTQAAKLLPELLAKSSGIKSDHSLISNWQGPTQSIRVHVDRDGTIRTTNYFGETHTGLQSVTAAIDGVPRFGNYVSVLLTSDSDGWDTPEKQCVIDVLFIPGVQIYVVNGG